MDPCIECQLIVSERHHAIQCDNCELWQHRVCGTGVLLEEYRAAVQSGNGLEWVCGPCIQDANVEDPADQVSFFPRFFLFL